MTQKSRSGSRAYIFDCTARLDALVEAHPLLVIRVLPMAEDVLVASVVGMLVQHPAATLYLDGVAAAEVRAQVRSVAGALVASPLKILVLKKHNLSKPKTKEFMHAPRQHLNNHNSSWTTQKKISHALEMQPQETLIQVLLFLTFPIVKLLLCLPPS